MTNDTKAPAKKTPIPSNEELLVGACELALLESAWDYYLHRPKIEKYLFAIDGPKISNVHAIPPHNVAHFGITGFLEAPDHPLNLKGMTPHAKLQHYKDEAGKYPLALGLTEIISRYIFNDRWSDSEPKLIFKTQLDTLTRIIDTVESNAAHEITTTLANVEKNNALRDLVDYWYRQKNATPEQFLSAVTKDLERLLPAMYGMYSNTRQLQRFVDILPFSDKTSETEEKLVFSHEYKEIDEILDFKSKYWGYNNSNRNPSEELESIANKWIASLRPSGKYPPDERPYEIDAEDQTQTATARTLAEIEFINREFRRNNLSVRISFITTTGRIFEAAVKRYNHPIHASTRYGPLDRLGKVYYFSKLISDHADHESSESISDVPLFDPRILMCDPDFVSYANRENKTEVDEQSRAISKWIPLFFATQMQGNIRDNSNRLFETYRYWQAKKRPSVKPADLLDPSDHFSQKDFDNLWKNWDEYIRLVSAAGGLERIVNRQMIADIRSMLFPSGDTGQAFKDLIVKRLSKTMSDWLAATGGKTLFDFLLTNRSNELIRNPPPLILPAFNGAQKSFYDLVSASHEESETSLRKKFNWLINPKPEQFNIDSRDTYKELKVRYIQMLGQAALFAKMDNWEAAQLLATQAYALANEVLSNDQKSDGLKFISGREAAYFSSVCLRRTKYALRFADSLVQQGMEWLHHYKTAIDKENIRGKLPNQRYELHLIRITAEKMGWRALSIITDSALSKESGRVSSHHSNNVFNAINNIEKLLTEIKTKLDFSNEYWSNTEKIDCDAYKLAANNLQRQLHSMALQLLILVSGVQEEHAATLEGHTTILSSLFLQKDGLGAEQLKPLEFERDLLYAAKKLIAQPSLSWIRPPLADNISFVEWRKQILKNIASI